MKHGTKYATRENRSSCACFHYFGCARVGKTNFHPRRDTSSTEGGRELNCSTFFFVFSSQYIVNFPRIFQQPHEKNEPKDWENY